MPRSVEERLFPARERWFWAGVGFVGALAFLLFGLGIATLRVAREAPRPPVRRAAVPSPAPLPEAPVAQPSLPLEPVKPRKLGAAPPDHAVSPTRSAPKALPGGARKPAPAVHIVERDGDKGGEARAPRPEIAKSGSPPTRPIVATSPSRVPGAGPARSPSEQVSGSRQEWSEASPRVSIGIRSRRDAVQPTIGDEDAPAGEARGITPPELVSGREAEYPLDAMRDGVTGTVQLKINVDPEGYVERAVVVRSSGDRRLDAAAIRAALAWRYEPAHRGRRPLAGVDTATFDFFREGRRGRRE